uniref:Uncharacterized protein n=1 Tax=Echeneis naucrates TaxID=173247 RepID=A0A665WVK5_ECHNA
MEKQTMRTVRMHFVCRACSSVCRGSSLALRPCTRGFASAWVVVYLCRNKSIHPNIRCFED